MTGVQPQLDGKAEQLHPPRVPRLGPTQRLLLRMLPLPHSSLRPAAKRSALLLAKRGIIHLADDGYWQRTNREGA